MVIAEKFLLLKLHPCVDGLSDEIVNEISQRCELLKLESGNILHRAYEPITSVFLVIHGRVKLSLIDIKGNVLMERQHTVGTQIGALAAASGEPSPMQVEVMEPSTILRFDYQTMFDLTKRYDLFRENLTRLIASSISNTLMGERKRSLPRAVAFFHQSNSTRAITSRVLSRLVQLGQNPVQFHDQEDRSADDGWLSLSVIHNGSPLSDNEIREKVDQMPNRKPIVFDMATSLDASRVSKIFEVSEKVFWCVTPDNWRQSLVSLTAILHIAPNWRDKVNVVWLLPSGTNWSPVADELTPLRMRDFKLSFDEPPPNRGRLLLHGLERIVHEIRGIRIGLALGGGAARGMAHLGVLRAFEENGIFVDMIAGTSAGAMTGILYASGMEPTYCADCFVKDLTPPWIFRRLPNGGYWHLLYKYRRGKFDPLLRKYLKDSQLQQLPIDVYSVTVDLISGKPIVRDSGDSVHAILESINLPVLSVPINRDGRALVDGGIVNNVPANVLVSKGCNFVIAVSVTAKIKQEFAKNHPDMSTARMKRASALETLMRTYVVQNVNMNSVGVQPADIVIAPNVVDFDITEFSRADEMAKIGFESAHESLANLKALLSRLDANLFQP